MKKGLLENLQILGFKSKNISYPQKKIPILFGMGIKYIGWEIHRLFS